MTFTKPFLFATLIVTLSGCASPAMDNENENAARNRGAVGGALLGATAGALTGDASLAVKGAALGGVTGGVAGSMKDTDDARNAQRTQVTADGLSQDNRTDAEKRVAEVEAEIKLIELEQQLADLKEGKEEKKGDGA
ncbi:Gly-zipper_Omp domain-containing protein [Vibrio chagasii]|nr:Gly-zipper_Omp domain-containing protein [Vibrio chagasii]CAH7352487.1 Gly-zipper_Omp domain-containing protein [Vibrio chagasii]CAH7410373.1 Gly-zipper_Omp domain-containing protein [Vibrio chagasii]